MDRAARVRSIAMEHARAVDDGQHGRPLRRAHERRTARRDLATRNRFFLCLRGDDPAFEPQQTRALLQQLQPIACVEVAR